MKFDLYVKNMQHEKRKQKRRPPQTADNLTIYCSSYVIQQIYLCFFVKSLLTLSTAGSDVHVLRILGSVMSSTVGWYTSGSK